MADSPAFALASQELERLTKMTSAEARGTMRLALRDAGLSAGGVRSHELRVVLEKLMPRELASRRIADGEAVCREIARRLTEVSDADAGDTPDAVFGRLGGR
jgi:hypothetical protein